MKPEISVVIPVCNEAENIGPLAREIAQALHGKNFEILFVDDGSTDNTAAAVRAARDAGILQIRLLKHPVSSGQSAAITTGVRAARAEWIGTLDGDGQNDPADLPKLLAVLRDPRHANVRLIAGFRAKRRDTWFKRVQSRIANTVRAALLNDATPDTGCGIKLFHRATYLQLPCFDHMHRFLPALFQRAGANVLSVPVHHRARAHGCSKYGMFDRLWTGIFDLMGVMWLMRRYKPGLAVTEE